MSEREINNFSGKKKRIWIPVTFLLIAGAAVGLFFYMNRQKNQPEEMVQMPTGVNFSENVITASGLTQVGMAAQEWELDFLTEGLEVEETYLHVGDSVDAGTPIFKVTQESLEIAREELELTEKEASLNLREGLITYETGKIEAQKEYDLAMVEAEYAQNTYDSALKSAQENLDAVQEQVTEAQKKVDEYTASIETNYYYTYYEVKEKQNLWYEYASLVIELYDKWNIEELEGKYGGMSGLGSSMSGNSSDSSESTDSTGQQSSSKINNSESQGTSSGQAPSGEIPSGGNMPSEGGSSSGTIPMSYNSDDDDIKLLSKVNTLITKSMKNQMEKSMENKGTVYQRSNMTVSSADTYQLIGVNSDEQSKYEVYSTLEEETALRKQEYEEALELYEDAKATAQAGIEQAKSELAVLESKLVWQQDNYEKAKLAAKAAYDLSLTAKDSAQMVYEATMDQLEEDYEALKDKQEEASENLTLLLEKVGDGYFYTEEAGTVMMSSVKEADILNGPTIVLAYQDTSNITVSASVQQENIASVAIGQEVVIYVSGYEAMEGTVTAIDPISGSSRSSSVSYSVTAAPVEAADGLEGNMTAYVYFGLNEEEKEMMMSGFGGNR